MRAFPVSEPAEAGAAGGAYALVLALPAAVVVALGRRRVALAPGRYLYAGSAYGPGGLAARLARHRRRDKPRRWHVDRLTDGSAAIEAMLAAPGGGECALVARALALPGAEAAAAGFGSSDCRRCPAHLVRLPAGARALEALAG